MQVHSRLWKVNHIFVLGIATVALGCQGGDANTLLAPLVLPELFVWCGIRDPVCVQVV